MKWAIAVAERQRIIAIISAEALTIRSNTTEKYPDRHIKHYPSNFLELEVRMNACLNCRIDIYA